jgi:hypothetical protein
VPDGYEVELLVDEGWQELRGSSKGKDNVRLSFASRFCHFELLVKRWLSRIV